MTVPSYIIQVRSSEGNLGETLKLNHLPSLKQLLVTELPSYEEIFQAPLGPSFHPSEPNRLPDGPPRPVIHIYNVQQHKCIKESVIQQIMVYP